MAGFMGSSRNVWFTRRRCNAWVALVGFACVLFVQLAAADTEGSPKYVSDARGQRPTPLVAIENVCAWPNLTVMRDGSIIATIFNQPSHGESAGDIECWATEDGGSTWAKRGAAAVHDSEDSNRMHAAAGLATNGDLLVITTGCGGQSKAGRAFRGRIEPVWISRSSDGGRSWAVDKKGFPSLPTGEAVIPFGDILPGHDGCLRVSMYAQRKYGGQMPYVFRSCDDGRTWGEPVAVAEHGHEAALLHLAAGTWLAAVRDNGLSLHRSDDDGRTWGIRKNLTDVWQHPGHLTRLRDKRLLLSYGNRMAPDGTDGNRTAPGGVDVRFSSDEGRSWTEPSRVVDCSGDRGYPSSVQLPDGRILTVYYAGELDNGRPAGQQTRQAVRPGGGNYHMGAVVWDPQSPR